MKILWEQEREGETKGRVRAEESQGCAKKAEAGTACGGESALRAGAEEDEPGDEVPDLALRRLAAGCVNKLWCVGTRFCQRE